MKIIVTGGGTGGHIYPAISLAHEFKDRDNNNEIIFVGSEDKMESDIVPHEGFPFIGIRVKGIERKVSIGSISALLLFLKSLFASYRIIKKIKPDLIIGTGGYVSGSVTLVASLLNIPTFIHEQNIIPGITNQFLSMFSKIVFTSFPETNKYFWKKNRIMPLGNPVRKDIWQGDKTKILKENDLNINKKTILVFGGSKGARIINETILDSINLIHSTLLADWQVLIVSGKDDFEEYKRKLDKTGYKEIIRILPYIYQIGDAYDLADLVVCRAGATTIAELTAKGIASVLIPYPYATRNHQLYNALFLEKNLAAIVIKEEELTKERVADELSKLMKDNEKLCLLANNSKNLGRRQAAKEIVNCIYDFLGRKTSRRNAI